MRGFAERYIRTEWRGPGTYRLLRPVVYTTDAGETITAEAGMVFDWASIPKPLTAIYSRDGPHAPAAVIHDWLYEARDRPRAEADAIFLEAMASLGLPWLRRRLFHLTVRLFGGVYWQEHD